MRTVPRACVRVPTGRPYVSPGRSDSSFGGVPWAEALPGAIDEGAWLHSFRVDKYFMKELGEKSGGKILMARTVPPARQVLEVRHQLAKQICRIYELQTVMLDLAEKHSATIMPGYTHFRHAQPTTFGHYILSVSDAIERSMKTVERGYHLMSLNEMGCGALAGTSWPIDRDLVSQYLGMEGLIENTNDAVSYADGCCVEPGLGEIPSRRRENRCEDETKRREVVSR